MKTAHWIPVFLALASGSCSRSGAEAEGKPAASATTDAPAGEPENLASGAVFRLEARAGAPGSLWGEASYKVKRVQGALSRKLELDILNAPPHSAHDVTLDGFALGKLTASAKGKGDLELVQDEEQLFPKGFVEPKAGSVLRVGELMELHFVPLERLVDLQALIAGPGELSGKATFRVERLGADVSREFQVKLAHAPVNSEHMVTVDGHEIGALSIDASGEGKLKFPARDSEPFPTAFPELRAGTRIRVGAVFEGALVDLLAGAKDQVAR